MIPVTGSGNSPHARGGIVASPHRAATEAGVEVLRRGGSAVDALIATAVVLCVAYPHMTGIGGDGFWLLWDPSDRRLTGINASGPAARLATAARVRELYDGTIPQRGPGSALTVPGAVDSWRLAHERFGRTPWPELFAAAIRIADRGLPAPRSLAHWAEASREVLYGSGAAAPFFLPGGEPIREGAVLRQPALADSLRALARHGARDSFYEGELGERLAAGLETAGSPLRFEDLRAYRAQWVEPIVRGYREVEIAELPPNTSGATALQILGMLERFDVPSWRDDSAEYVHYQAECARLALADRDAWLGDPAFAPIPVDRLLASEYLARRAALVAPERAMTTVTAGIEPPSPRRAPLAGGDTCAFCAVDRYGGFASAIQSLFEAFGSAFVEGDTGILLHNRGSAFRLEVGTPNSLEPGKRPAHTLIPAMLLRDGEPALAFGTMGGEGQPQIHAALVTRIVDFGLPPQAAIDAPRWVAGRPLGAGGSALYVEDAFSGGVIGALQARGHDVRVVPAGAEIMGHACAVGVDPATRALVGGADPRSDGAVIAF